jgi:O-acetyl-ADP-ribose deacetylase (regulator of RNase III)
MSHAVMGTAPVTLEARIADITTLTVDAIVNAANTQLAQGGGVCGAIFRAAGAAELAAACATVAPCPVGEARITPGFRLPARFVIHAVGPVWHGGEAGEAELLASAYRTSMRVAAEHGVRTMAFPAISTGIFGYPLGEATRTAVAAVREVAATGAGTVERVIFACFSQDVLTAYTVEGVETAQ